MLRLLRHSLERIDSLLRKEPIPILCFAGIEDSEGLRVGISKEPRSVIALVEIFGPRA